MPFYIMRQFESNGKYASGGRIYTYESGTNTPKTTWKNAELTIPHENPIILSASGSAVVFLAEGAYGILITTSTGAQIEPRVEGITGGSGGGGGAGSNSTFSTVKIYDDLRALPDIPDAVYVNGKLAEGDGGVGWFQLIPGSTLNDDDGIILTSGAGSNVYKRVFDAVIDPQWYGVQYGISADQTISLNKALAASVIHNFPVQVTGSTYINQNITAPTKSALTVTDDGFFTASLNVTITFADESKFNAVGRTFGSNVNAVFGKNVTDAICISWFGAAVDDTRLSKWIASSTNTLLKLDQIVVVANNSLVSNAPFISEPDAYIDWGNSTGSLNIQLPAIQSGYQTQRIFKIPATRTLTIDLGTKYAYPEWFGANGNGSINDYLAVYQSALSGKVLLTENRIYAISSAFPTNIANVTYAGKGTLQLAQYSALTNTSVVLDGVTVTYAGTGDWLTCTTLFATDSAFPSTYTATNKSISGCIYTDDSRFPVQDGTPAIYNGHLPLIPNAGQLSTNNVGKIYSGSPLQNGGNRFDLTYYGDVGSYNQANNFNKIKYFDDGTIFVIGNLGEIFRSDDGGLTWNDETIFSGGSQNDEKFYLKDITKCGTNKYFIASGDRFNTWVSQGSATSFGGTSNPLGNSTTAYDTDAHSIGYDDATDTVFTVTNFCRVATQLANTPSLLQCGTGTLCPEGAGKVCRKLNGIMVIAGYDSSAGNVGTYWTASTPSNNAGAWAKYSIGTTVTILDMIYADGKYIAVGTGGYVAWSTTLGSGAVWTRAVCYSTGDITGIAYVPGDGYYLSSSSGVILFSADLRYFGNRYSGVTQNLSAITYNNVNGVNRLLVSGDKRVVLVSK
jgi:hypothetical protein